MTFVSRIYRDFDGRDPVEIHYKLHPLRKTQPRLKSRYVLQPIIDLDDYQTTAVIDWVEFEIETKTPTQHQHLNTIVVDRLGTEAFFKVLNPGPGNVATRFRVRFQEPDVFVLNVVMDDLRRSKGFASPVRMTGLEVAIDFRPHTPSEHARALLYGVLVRHFSPDLPVPEDKLRWPGHASQRRRVYLVGRSNSSEERDLRLRHSGEQDQKAIYGTTFYVGRKDDPVAMWRLQNKTVDKQNLLSGTKNFLPENERRVRLEVSLGPESLGILGLRTEVDLGSVSMSRLQRKFFRFRLPTFATHHNLPPSGHRAARVYLENWRRDRFLKSGVMGLQIGDRAGTELKKRGRNEFRKTLRTSGKKLPPLARAGTGRDNSLVNYENLARRVEYALRHLWERNTSLFR